MDKKIALVGNPNCGKTTFFNSITGSNQYVGNWPGVTVEQKIGKSKYKDINIEWIDLPGIYSLVPYSMEEKISEEYLRKESVDYVLNIVDATNLERSLYLTVQLLEMRLPVILVLNMMDLVRKNGIEIIKDKLSKYLDIEIFEISAAKKQGIDSILEYICFNKAETKPFNWNNYNLSIDGKFESNCEILETDRLPWEKLHHLERCSVDDKLISNCDKKDIICKDMRSKLIQARYNYIEKIVNEATIKKKDTAIFTDKIDKIVTHPILALPIFLIIMALVYYLSVQSIGKKLVGLFEHLININIAGGVKIFLEYVGTSSIVQDLVLNGILVGVGSVVTFLPQIALIFFFISILEDSGYMARIALVMDKYFRRFGLSGKAFIPMMVGTGCSVPGIMAARALDTDKERKLVIMILPFISCSAKLPVYVLFASSFFPDYAGLVLFSMYVGGILWMFFSAFVLNKFMIKEPSEGLLIELPKYKMPQIKTVLLQVWDRSKSFLKKAGTVIFLASVIIWCLQAFTINFEKAEDPETSIIADVGKTIAPVFKPLGFGEWKPSVAILTGVAAKEAVVSTLGVLNGVEEADEKNELLLERLKNIFTPASALSFIVFILLASPCISAIIAIYRELNSLKLMLFALFYQTGLAWIVSFIVYQVANKLIYV